MAASIRPYLTVKALAEYLGYTGTPRGKASAARDWVTRTGVKKYWRGKVWLVKPDDVDAVLSGQQVAS